MIAVLLLWMSWFLGPILAYAAIAKTIQFRRFKSHVASLGMIPIVLAWPLTLAVPAGECLLAALLMSGMKPTLTFLSTAGLLGIFTVFVGWLLHTGNKASCYCFGEDDADISFFTLVRNLALLGLALLGGLLSLFEGLVLSWPESILVVMYGVASALLFLTAYKVVNLWSMSRSFV